MVLLYSFHWAVIFPLCFFNSLQGVDLPNAQFGISWHNLELLLVFLRTSCWLSAGGHFNTYISLNPPGMLTYISVWCVGLSAEGMLPKKALPYYTENADFSISVAPQQQCPSGNISKLWPNKSMLGCAWATLVSLRRNISFSITVLQTPIWGLCFLLLWKAWLFNPFCSSY